MAHPRPDTLSSLADAYNNCVPKSPTFINLMGIVVDILPSIQNKTSSDWQMTFTIQDAEMMKIQCPTKGLKARFFVSNQNELPQIRSIGDIVLIRHCKILYLFGSPIIANIKRNTSTTVFQADKMPEPGYIQTFLGGQKDLDCSVQGPNSRASMAEQLYAVGLKDLIPSATTAVIPSRPAPIPVRPVADKVRGSSNVIDKKFRLIQNINYNDYCDLVVEVVKKFPDPHGEYMELYVTDYTSNDLLYDYAPPNESGNDDGSSRDGDLYSYIPNLSGKHMNWTGPYGRHTLKVELLPPHAGAARDKLKEGDFVMLQNVRIKQSNAHMMEGNLWRDKIYPDKILVQRIQDATRKDVKTLLNRRTNYWAYHNKKFATEISKEEQDKQDKQDKPERKKNKAKIRKNKAAKESKLKESNTDTTEPRPDSDVGLSNKHVSVQNKADASTLGDIHSRNYSYHSKSGQELALPFLNVQHKVRARVVDFWPPALEDFASLAQSNKNSGQVSEVDVDMLSPPSQKWIWDFFLLLEDFKSHRPGLPPAQQWVHVNDEDATYLLSIDEDAADLRSDSQTLAKLREQMAILWGNLEELKSASTAKQQYPRDTGRDLSNLPFSTCIKEYGQKSDELDLESEETSGYTRVYAMTGVRIFGQ